MNLTIVTPSGILCHTTIESISLPGTAGRFTVLENHAPLIASLTAGEIVYIEQGRENRLMIRGGFARIHKNQIEATAEIDDAVQ